MNLLNLGSLITYKDSEYEVTLGYLIDFKDRGIFDANLGKVDVSPEQADIHNKLFDNALIQGLDENCQVKQGGFFYYNPESKTVKTFLGTLISNQVEIKRQTIIFQRNGKTFKGKLTKDSDLVFFERIT